MIPVKYLLPQQSESPSSFSTFDGHDGHSPSLASERKKEKGNKKEEDPCLNNERRCYYARRASGKENQARKETGSDWRDRAEIRAGHNVCHSPAEVSGAALSSDETAASRTFVGSDAALSATEINTTASESAAQVDVIYDAPWRSLEWRRDSPWRSLPWRRKLHHCRLSRRQTREDMVEVT